MPENFDVSSYAPPGVYTIKESKPLEQADGYVADADDATELVEELVSTTLLYDTFGRFITQLTNNFIALQSISKESNPVLTHIAICDAQEILTTAAHSLRDELIEKLAQRGEQITEKGGTLRTQVLNDEDEDN